MAAARRGRAACAIERHGDGVPTLGRAHASGIEAHMDALFLQYLSDRIRGVLIFTPDQTRPHFDYRDLAAKSPIHLREFDTDIASSDNHQMRREEIDAPHGAV